MSTHPYRFRHLMRFLLYGGAVFVVILAVLMSVARLVISEVDVYRNDIEAIASRYLNRAIQIEKVDAEFEGLTPTLIFKNVKLLDDNKEVLFSFKQAGLGLNILASIKAGQLIPGDFNISGMEIAIIRKKDGSFSVKGIDISVADDPSSVATGKSNEISDWLLNQTWLNVRDSTVIWLDQTRDNKRVVLENVNIMLRNSDGRHQLKVWLKLQETIGRNIELALDSTGNMLDPVDWQGDIYFRATGLHLERLGILPSVKGYKMVQGIADVELWGAWNRGGVDGITGDITTYNLWLNHPQMQQPFKTRLISGLFKFNQFEHGWDLDINKFHYMDADGSWPESNFSVSQRMNDHKPLIEFSADYFRLENMNALLTRLPLLPSDQETMLTTLSPSGDVHNLNIVFSNLQPQPDLHIAALFHQVGFNAWRSIPGIRGLNGEIRLEPHTGWLRINSEYAVLDYQKMFRNTIELSKLSAMLRLDKTEAGWQLQSDEVIAENNDIKAHAGLLLSIPENSTSPFMDLQVSFAEGDARQAGQYYPVSIMSSGLISWLDRGIVRGDITSGGAVFHGRLADFPFRQNEGQFEVSFHAENATIDYRENWPHAHEIELDALFTGRGMEIHASSGKILNSQVSATDVIIDDFRNARLDISGQVDGEVKDAVYYLVDSPLFPSARELVKGFNYEGNAHLLLDLGIPIKDKQADVSVQGTVALNNAAVYMLDDLIDITAVNGSLSFSEKALGADEIRATIMGNDSVLTVNTDMDNENRPVVIRANGELDSRRLLKQFGLPAAGQVDGRTDWQAEFRLPYRTKQKAMPATLQLTSDLYGIAIDLPAPIKKDAEEHRPFILNAQLQPGRTVLKLQNTDVVSAGIQLDMQAQKLRPVKGFLHFGEGPRDLPDENAIYISGRLNNFRLLPWVAALKQGDTKVTGSFVPLPLVFDMAALQFAPVETDDDQTAVKSRSETTPLEVNNVPIIRGQIDQIAYDDVSIGKLEFKTSRSPDGMSLEKLVLLGEQLNMQATGEWNVTGGSNRSKLDIDLTSPDLGRMLTSLGFSAILRGGETHVKGTLSWPDTPAGITLSNIEGTFYEKVEDGSITSVEPGAGRLLGLFSLSALPRRLIFDFSDAFGKGLHFDSVEGDVYVRNGNVIMDNNVMKSPLAVVTIDGRTGLVERDFEQRITVIPQGGDALSVVAGGMVFGPQIGAAILLVQKILGKDIGEAIAMEYEITGTWEKPVITRMNAPEKIEEENGKNQNEIPGF